MRPTTRANTARGTVSGDRVDTNRTPPSAGGQPGLTRHGVTTPTAGEDSADARGLRNTQPNPMNTGSSAGDSDLRLDFLPDSGEGVGDVPALAAHPSVAQPLTDHSDLTRRSRVVDLRRVHQVAPALGRDLVRGNVADATGITPLDNTFADMASVNSNTFADTASVNSNTFADMASVNSNTFADTFADMAGGNSLFPGENDGSPAPDWGHNVDAGPRFAPPARYPTRTTGPPDRLTLSGTGMQLDSASAASIVHALGGDSSNFTQSFNADFLNSHEEGQREPEPESPAQQTTPSDSKLNAADLSAVQRGLDIGYTERRVSHLE